MATPDQLLQALQAVVDPNTGKDFVTTKALKNLQVAGGDVSFEVELGYPAKSQIPALRRALIAAAKGVAGVENVSVNVTQKIVAHAAQRGVALLPKVKNIVAVASGKGGVGKSTTAVNLALALAAEGASVGLLDADIYGPSQPMMMGIEGRPRVDRRPDHGADGELRRAGHVDRLPGGAGRGHDLARAHGHAGAGAVAAPDQLEGPGLSDRRHAPRHRRHPAHPLQRVPMTGAVIVTTPQDIALLDAKKGIKMFEKVGVPILGIVENMAVHVCSNCGHVEHIFGADGGKKMAAEYGMDYLGALPLDIQIRQQADSGKPTVVADPDGEVATIYKTVARQMAIKIAAKAKDFSSKFPSIKISKDT